MAAATMREPSRGGIGIRLNTPSTTFTEKDSRMTLRATSDSGTGPWTMYAANRIAITKFVAGPAAAITAICC